MSARQVPAGVSGCGAGAPGEVDPEHGVTATATASASTAPPLAEY